ncbi:MAG: hypothetical protein HY562_11605 [Ignavibacteriales bacterium]|nr:hypothetical protein [Ignavibacteriales bacterium]
MKTENLKKEFLLVVLMFMGCTKYADLRNPEDLQTLEGKSIIVCCKDSQVYRLDRAMVGEHIVGGSGKKFDRQKNSWTDFSGTIARSEVSAIAVETVDVRMTAQWLATIGFHVFAIVALYVYFGRSGQKQNSITYYHGRTS